MFLKTRTSWKAKKMRKNKDSGVSGIVLLEKKAGITSFQSLSQVKKTLGTSKVGHTGTLDSFAEGLLVVLVGHMTHLVPHITNFDKTYIATIQFGSETDTLDPTGNVIKQGFLPDENQIKNAITKFKGEILQVPPAYSALHIDGKRASDLMREGKEVEMKGRPVTIFQNDFLEYDSQSGIAKIEVTCSKGTYIRSLARDVANEIGTCAHLVALKRTRIGPFSLEDAESSEEKPFTFFEFSKETAQKCGFSVLTLPLDFEKDYNNGMPLKNIFKRKEVAAQSAVFYEDGTFAGIIGNNQGWLKYGFVVHKKSFDGKKLKIFSWNDLVSGKISEYLKNKSSSLTIGSFDGPHVGHKEIFKHVKTNAASKNGKSGVITFTKPLAGLKHSDVYLGDIATLDEKLSRIGKCGLDFAVVIDFDEVRALDGMDFLKNLVENANMEFLAEGGDFHFGYKGSCNNEHIREYSENLLKAGVKSFEFEIVQPVLFEGERVSSSRIRECIKNGEKEKVALMLGE